MRVLLLHSDVPPDAPPDELDTLRTADAVTMALRARGHDVTRRPFTPDPAAVEATLAAAGAEIVFNLVESVFGRGDMAGLAPAILEHSALPFTGALSAAISCAANKPLTKQLLRAGGLPTPDWSEPPRWTGLADDRHYVVKSATEDSSIGLDDGAVVKGAAAVRARAALSVARHGGVWFAESYCPGREFNVSLLENDGGPSVLPIAEIAYSDWPTDRPRLVGYAAKWDPESPDCIRTPRAFGIEKEAPELSYTLGDLSCRAWRLLCLRGYARVDFRLDADGAPTILEVNPNPCLEPEAGFPAAALNAGMSYAELVERILNIAIRR
jgi:D-alanine-D-alanine ligase